MFLLLLFSQCRFVVVCFLFCFVFIFVSMLINVSDCCAAFCLIFQPPVYCFLLLAQCCLAKRSVFLLLFVVFCFYVLTCCIILTFSVCLSCLFSWGGWGVGGGGVEETVQQRQQHVEIKTGKLQGKSENSLFALIKQTEAGRVSYYLTLATAKNMSQCNDLYKV